MSDSRPTSGVRAVGSAPALDGPPRSRSFDDNKVSHEGAALVQHRYRRMGNVRGELNPTFLTCIFGHNELCTSCIAARPQKIKGISIFVDCWYSG